MKRIALFVMTNVAVLVVLSIVMRIIGIDSILNEQGTGLDFYSLLIFSAVIGFGGSAISLAMSKWIAKRMTGAVVITNPSNAVERWLLDTVQRQSRQAGIACPEVAVFEAAEVNAFATGARKNSALVAVSTGLLRQLNKEEAEAVLGHEVSHVANGDMVTMALLQGVVNTFVIFASRIVGFIVDRVVFRTERGIGPGFFIASIVSQIIFGILASFIVMWFSRQREFRADAGGAQLAGREKMISALASLERTHRSAGLQDENTLPEPIKAFGIFGRKDGGWRKLLSSHPTIEERIDALRRG